MGVQGLSCIFLIYIKGETKVQPKDHNTHLLVIIVINLLLLASVLVVLVVIIKKCRSRSADLPRVERTTREDNRENTDDEVEEELATDHTELLHEGLPTNESSDLNTQIRSGEPSGESPVSGDSSVKVRSTR